jgi:hypothetical protein
MKSKKDSDPKREQNYAFFFPYRVTHLGLRHHSPYACR